MTRLCPLLAALLPALLGAAEMAAPALARPNLVLIVADDLGYGDVGCYGGTLTPTPAIDALARGGVRFSDGYVTAPVCAPSRFGLLSGAYPQRFGMQWNEDAYVNAYAKLPLPAAHRTLPEALRAAGYVTGHIGKWNFPRAAASVVHEAYAVMDWEGDYFPGADGRYIGVDDPTKRDSGKVHGVWGPERPGEEYLTDRLGRHAVEFITKHKGEPFFLYLAFNAVHSPWQAKAADRERFAHIAPEPLNLYAAMVASLDENVGRVLAALKDVGLEDNTLVAFVSDNGPAFGSSRIKGWPEGWAKEVLVGSAGPLNGRKGQFLEGGIREPFILRWPARLKAAAEFRQPVSTMDLYPTFLAAAGVAVPEGTRLDGVDLLPHLLGQTTGRPHELLFWKNGEQGAVREGDWKLLLSPWQPKLQLFNLAEDLGETHDLAADQPELTARLHQAWLDWGAALPPRANPPAAKAPAGTPQAPAQDRAALFATKDKDQDGRLSRDEFLANQRDPEEAKGRFEKWDVNRDGSLSRDEFIEMGARRR